MYTQSSKFTNLATSMMFIMNHFNKDFKLNKENEYTIWLRTVNLPIKASSIYAIALYAKKQGLKTKMYIGDKSFSFPNYRFRGYTKIEIEEAKYVNQLYQKKAEEEGVEMEEHDFNFDFVKKLVKEGKVLLLRVNMGVLKNLKAISQYVSVLGFRSGKFTIIDAEHGEKQEIEENLLKDAFEKLCEKCHRDHRMIVFG